MSDSDDSDYVVEQFVKPDRIGRVATNDVSADILGNFDDQKRKNIENNVPEEEELADEDNDEVEDEEESDEEAEETTVDADGQIATSKKRSASGDEPASKKPKKSKNGEIGDEEIAALLRGVSKANRFVLYVTNLNFATSKERLAEYFSQAGAVKTVRIPKKRKGGFAFIEMSDITAFKNAFALHNSMLDERPIKVQLSEAGKKKSANKKNILKQKNRKLSEMRNESKSFSKSGKNYDKTIKKEIAKEKMQQQKMWERMKARKANRNKKPAA